MPGVYTYPVEKGTGHLRLEIDAVDDPPLLAVHRLEFLAGKEYMLSALRLSCHHKLHTYVFCRDILNVKYYFGSVGVA